MYGVWGTSGYTHLPTQQFVPTQVTPSQIPIFHSCPWRYTLSPCVQFAVLLPFVRAVLVQFLLLFDLCYYQFKPAAMTRPVATKVASLVALAASSALVATAHPLCFYGPDRAVSMTSKATYCPDDQPEGFCCEPDEEAVLEAKFNAAAVSEGCKALYKEVSKR